MLKSLTSWLNFNQCFKMHKTINVASVHLIRKSKLKKDQSYTSQKSATNYKQEIYDVVY